MASLPADIQAGRLMAETGGGRSRLGPLESAYETEDAIYDLCAITCEKIRYENEKLVNNSHFLVYRLEQKTGMPA
jgi:hypothetical protein